MSKDYQWCFENSEEAADQLKPLCAAPQPAEQQPSPDVKRDDDYRTWYKEAIVASNEAGFVGMSAAQVIKYQGGEIIRLRADVTALVEALEQVIKAARCGGPLWHGSDQIVEARLALAAFRQGVGSE